MFGENKLFYLEETLQIDQELQALEYHHIVYEMCPLKPFETTPTTNNKNKILIFFFIKKNL